MNQYKEGACLRMVPAEWKITVHWDTRDEKKDLLITDTEGNMVIHGKVCRGNIAVLAQFDSHPRPLRLSAETVPAEHEICLLYTITRLALYVDGCLHDEEFPMGNIRMNGSRIDSLPGPFYLDISTDRFHTDFEDGGGSIDGLLNWKPDYPGLNCGDGMPFTHGRDYHLFFLLDRRRANSKWCNLAHRIGHLISHDLQHWTYLPMAVNLEHQREACISTGSAIYFKGKYYIFYGIRMMDGSPTRISCSVSEDGIHFQRTPYSVSLKEPYHMSSARDPHVFCGDDDRMHMTITTSIRTADGWRGCLAHLVSGDGMTWEQQDTPIIQLTDADFQIRSDPNDLSVIWEHPGEGMSVSRRDLQETELPCDTNAQPECSDYFMLGEWYYLTYNLFGYSRYYMSKNPFGPWIRPEINCLSTPRHRVPKFAKYGKDRIYAVPYVAQSPGYGGVLTLLELKQRPDGSLFLADWE